MTFKASISNIHFMFCERCNYDASAWSKCANQLFNSIVSILPSS